VGTTLRERLGRVPVGARELRAAFVRALALIGACEFHDVFKAELGSDRALGVRRAAVAGLGDCGNAASAGDLRSLLGALEPEIRAEAIGALGRCGRDAADLAALGGRLEAGSEAEASIRELAWEGYKLVSMRLPAQELAAVAEGFAASDEKSAQRRRLELLELLTGSAQKFERLSVPERIGVYEQMAEAMTSLGDHGGAVARLGQAMGLVGDPGDGRFASLAARQVSVLLRGGEEKSAARRIGELADSEGAKSGVLDSSPLATAVLTAVDARIDGAADAGSYAEAKNLISIVFEPSSRLSSELGTRLAAEKLAAFGAGLVLPGIHGRLAALPTTSAPADGLEGRLVGLARELAPDWPGYEVGCAETERASRLEMLRAVFAPVQTMPATTGPAAGSP
jgi:hypothetical protein